MSHCCWHGGWIWLAWTPKRLDNSATVPSSRTAASATFALNSGPCFFRVLVMSHLRPDGRSKGRLSLSYLSSFRGPPQDMPHWLPVDPSRFHRDVGAALPGEPFGQRQQPGPSGVERPHLGAGCAIRRQPHAGDNAVLVHVQSGAAGMKNFLVDLLLARRGAGHLCFKTLNNALPGLATHGAIGDVPRVQLKRGLARTIERPTSPPRTGRQ
jgi:hypothetical protein